MVGINLVKKERKSATERALAEYKSMQGEDDIQSVERVKGKKGSLSVFGLNVRNKSSLVGLSFPFYLPFIFLKMLLCSKNMEL